MSSFAIGRIESGLDGLGLTLPAPLTPPGSFELIKVHGGLAYIAVAQIDRAASVLRPVRMGVVGAGAIALRGILPISCRPMSRSKSA